MDAKQYLCRYHNILEKIKIKEEYVSFCRERESSISSPSYDPMPKSPNIDTEASFVKWLIKRRTAEDELLELQKEAERIRLETEKKIMDLNDETYIMILIMRYLEWQKWVDIANRLYASVATIKRRHERALTMLKTT